MAKHIYTSQELATYSVTDAQAKHAKAQRRELLLISMLAIIYIVIVGVHCVIRGAPEGGSHFVYLADGWLRGHLYIHDTPPALSDYTLHNGHWYVAFPPLPALLLLPFVAVLHLRYQAVLTLAFSIAMGIVDIVLMLRVYKRLAQYSTMTFATSAWLLVLFALGTEHFYATMQGNVWYLAHVVATTFLLLYIDETLGKRRPWLAGIFLGLAVLARSTTLFTLLFFLVLTYAERRKMRELCQQWSKFGGVLCLFVGAMLLYNLARFGSLLDFGYTGMNVNPLLSADLHIYGQFSKHFIRTNLRYMWLEPPRLLKTFPYVTFNPFGTGIFWTTPALLLAFLAFRLRTQRWLALSLLAACALPIAAILLYFNTGWYQFGYRFAMDFLPFALLLATLGMRSKLWWPEKALITLSVLMNVWGYFVFAYFRPPLLG